MTLPARLFDGQSSAAREGWLQVDAAGFTWRDAGDAGDAGTARHFAHADVTVSSRLGNTPRQLACRDGVLIEVADNDAFDAALRAAGRETGVLHALESRWLRVAGLFVAAGVLVLAFALWGLPAIVDATMPLVPRTVDRAVGDHVLDGLGQPPFALAPSALPLPRQREIEAQWRRRVLSHADLPGTLHFRAGGWLGANAIALPGGHFVVTDELVALAANDEEVLAALAHELGHDARRHGMRMLAESLTIAAALAMVTGDVNSLAAAAPAILLGSRYSRDKEEEADRYAIDLLQAEGIPSSRLGDMLARLQQAHAEAEPAGWTVLFSSHPSTAERVERASDGAPAR